MTRFSGYTSYLIFLRFLGALIIVFNGIHLTFAQEWVLEKDQNDIQIFTKKVENSDFKAYRAVMTVSTTIEKLDKIMRNQAALKTWFDRCTESKRLKKVSDNEFYLYFVNDAPWPIQDRDNITQAVFETKSDGSSWIYLKCIPDYLPPKKNKVRIPEMTAHWEFHPVADGQIKIVQQAHFDLGGTIPAWLANIAVVDSPFNTMANLKNLLKK